MKQFASIPDEWEIRHIGSYGAGMDVSIETRDDDTGPLLKGTGIVFNSPSVDLGMGFREIILPRAVTAALDNSDLRSIFNHNPDNLLGRESAGTMRAKKVRSGVNYEVDLDPEDQLHMRVRGMVQRGDLTGSSFIFLPAKDGATYKETDGVMVRTVTKMDAIMSMEPVVFPAYETTRVSARSLDEAKKHSFEAMEHLEAYQKAMRKLVDERVEGELARA